MAFENIELLRLYLGDPDPDQDGVGDAFTDPQLENLLILHDDDVKAAAADGWKMKAATVSDWYQAMADGSNLSRQQVFEHCLQMSEMYDKESGISFTSIRTDVEYETGSEPEGDDAV